MANRVSFWPVSEKPGHDLLSGGLRFLTEIIAWVGAPWALWSHSIPLAVLSVVLLIGLPAVFSTPGDRPGGDGPVAVPGIVTILLLVLQLVVATAAAWVLWPSWIAAVVTVLCLAVVGTEQPRWRALTGHGRNAGGHGTRTAGR